MRSSGLYCQPPPVFIAEFTSAGLFPYTVPWAIYLLAKPPRFPAATTSYAFQPAQLQYRQICKAIQLVHMYHIVWNPSTIALRLFILHIYSLQASHGL